MTMPAVLLPRVSRLTIDRIVDRLRRDSAAAAIGDIVEDDLRQQTFAATGGRKASDAELHALREAVLGIVRDLKAGSLQPAAMRAEFDARCTILLGDLPLFRSGEALRDDVWAYIAGVLLRDVALWRFQGVSPDRYQGGVRNAFQRLWQRARVFDRGADHPRRWELVRALTEDAFVQILERPSICSSQRLSLAIAEGWLRYSEMGGRAQMEGVMRRAIRNLRITNQIVLLECLEDAELMARVDEAFQVAL